MKEYKIILHSDAESDVESSFKWLSSVGKTKRGTVGAEATAGH